MAVVSERGADVGARKIIGREPQDQAIVCTIFADRSMVAGHVLISAGMPRIERIERSLPHAKVRRMGS